MKAPELDLVTLHGAQDTTAEDRAYRGSRYAEVREALCANPYRGGAYGQEPGPLPMFKSSIWNAWRGLFSGENKFRQASARVLDSKADLRWGPDGKGYRRIIAPNGICVLGTWEITEDNPYTGYFRKGSKGLTIGRFSSDGNETKRGERRSISLGMKIYPTMDPAHSDPTIPASVIVQEDLGGMRTAYINDVELVNAPSVHAYRRGIFVLIMLRANMLFSALDKVPDSRQVFEVAELGEPPDIQTVAPEHMMFKMAPDQPRITGEGLDFREEIYRHIFDSGAASPTGTMEFDIWVAPYGRKSGIRGLTTVKVDDWERIGKLRFKEAVASYNGDHVIHFHHPGWRDDRNDRSTYIRSRETRVRR
ncbi:hypothetical protein GOC69_12180 [Sinorhizobium medicae]|nr:hypothetical protein [Sinorhizobium medicae]MDX0475203.1 hypothetical protein [Sinorhizobium medicae]